MPSPPALTETPTGRYSLPLVRCAQLFASLTAVQTMLSVASASDALDMIDYPTRDTDQYGEQVPGIIIRPGRQKGAYGSGDQGGVLFVELLDALAVATHPIDFKNDLIQWMNRLGDIVGQLLAASKQPMADFGGERFDVIRFADVFPPTHDHDEVGAATRWFRYAALEVEWTT